jgi:hypothetical protein
MSLDMIRSLLTWSCVGEVLEAACANHQGVVVEACMDFIAVPAKVNRLRAFLESSQSLMVLLLLRTQLITALVVALRRFSE